MLLPSWATNQSFSSGIYPNLSCGGVWLKSTRANPEKKQQQIISVLFRRLISVLSICGPRIKQGSLKKYQVAVGRDPLQDAHLLTLHPPLNHPSPLPTGSGTEVNSVHGRLTSCAVQSPYVCVYKYLFLPSSSFKKHKSTSIVIKLFNTVHVIQKLPGDKKYFLKIIPNYRIKIMIKLVSTIIKGHEKLFPHLGKVLDWSSLDDH